MPTEKQIGANRRNARRSTGPRSCAGKKRASRNSYRHGLSASGTSSNTELELIGRLARTIVGNTENVVALACARTIARAQFNLAQIQRVKLALISGQIGLGGQAETESEYSAEALQRALAELIKVDRYESRAWARRDRAMANLSSFKKSNDCLKV